MVSSVPVPFIWFPFFILSPFTHFFFLFLFMPSLASCPVISLLSFSCAHNGPGLSLYAHIHCTLRSQVAQVLIMRFGSLFVPVHLVPSSSQPHTLLSCLVLFSCLHLFVLGCVHLCTHVLTLLVFAPLGEACVCVPLVVTGIHLDCTLNFFPLFSRGLVVHASTSPTKRLALNTNIGGDAHRRTCFLRTFELL